MNPIEDLQRRLSLYHASLDVPGDPGGKWFLDVFRDGGLDPIVVEWWPGLSFGVSTPGPDDYGTKPDEWYPNVDSAYARVVELLETGGHTVAQSEPTGQGGVQ